MIMREPISKIALKFCRSWLHERALKVGTAGFGERRKMVAKFLSRYVCLRSPSAIETGPGRFESETLSWITKDSDRRQEL